MSVRQYTLLGIFAHPDDESFGPGGTLARYAAEGANVHVIIATDGIAGSVGDESYTQTHETLAQVRSTELSDAAVALGITTIWSLPYRDSGMRGSPENENPDALIQQPLGTLIDDIRGYMERLQPDVVITHDPFGGYGHPDHIRCCEATTAAFHLLAALTDSGPDSAVEESALEESGLEQSNVEAYRPQKLYYTAFDKRMLKIIVKLMPLWGADPTAIGRNKDIDLVEISRWHTPVHARVNVGDYLEEKDRASRAHASQYSGAPSYIRALPSFLRKRFLSADAFTRAYPAPALSTTTGLETDLFSGI